MTEGNFHLTARILVENVEYEEAVELAVALTNGDEDYVTPVANGDQLAWTVEHAAVDADV
jgi:hypothetical protein